MHWLMIFAQLWYFICMEFVSLHWILSCIYWDDSYIHQCEWAFDACIACFCCDGLSLVAHHTELLFWYIYVWVVKNYRLNCIFYYTFMRMSQFCLHNNVNEPLMPALNIYRVCNEMILTYTNVNEPLMPALSFLFVCSEIILTYTIHWHMKSYNFWQHCV